MNSLDQTLERFVAAQPGADLVSAAQGRLDAAVAARVSVTQTRRGKRGVTGWLAATASALVAAVAFVWLPLTPTPALAFSTVQEHLRDFRTLRVEMRQRVAGQEGTMTRISVTRDGKLRTDVGKDLSVIVNAAENRVITLVHEEHLAVESPLGADAGESDSLDWLEDIRNFQGVAKRLPEPRLINGHRSYGWQLEVQSLTAVLWTTDEGVPLEMIMTGAGDMRFDFRFEYDVPLPAQTFSTAIPAGYSRAKAED
jgi:hypothetical protein